MILKILLAAGLLLSQSVVAETETFRFSRPVIWQDKGQQELLTVPLDSRIYAATGDGFPDLRLVDQNGAETPYLLQKAAETRAETKRISCNSRLLALKKKNKTIEIYLRLDKNEQNADGLTVVTPLADFEHRVQIFGSNDGKSWSSLVEDAQIFDYSSYMPIANRDISLPANAYRQFKLVVEEAMHTREAELKELTRTLRGEEEMTRSERIDLHRIPLKIERIDSWRNHTEVLPETDKRFEYPVAEYKITEGKKKQATLIDVTTLREPLTGFTLHTATDNFTRSAVVQIPIRQGIETSMQVIGSALLESLHFRDIKREQTAVSFPEQRQKTYRIVLSNQDNPPLAVTGITGTGPGYNLIFLPSPGKTYRLHYGSEKAKRPVYDTGPIQELLRRGYKGIPAELGPESAEASVPETLDFAKLLNSQWFLGMAVALMVVVLGWVLVRAGKRIEQFPKE
jgi:hypothetical protein